MICFFNYSNQRTITDYEETTSNNESLTITSKEISTTTSWWTRTFPIIITRTARPRRIPKLKTTTVPIRISKIVFRTVPTTIFGVTIIFGFGLIIFALITHGYGVSFLTRTNEHRLV